MSCSNPTSPMEHAIVTVSDNTWRKKMEQKKIEMERLQGVLEMAGAVCHELNQPLQGLFLVVDTMALKDSLSTEDIEAIKPHIKRMAEITAKLMRVTRYETLEYINGKKIIDINRASSREEH